MVNGDRIEGLKYYLEVWRRNSDYGDEIRAGDVSLLGNFSFDTFEDMWCFVDTYRDHYESPNRLDFEVTCH